MEKFIITLSEHRALGFCFIPYLVTIIPNKEFYVVKERLTEEKINDYQKYLPDQAEYIIKTIEEYNDHTLLKLFSKKKISPQDFYKSISDEFKATHLRPYIEKRLLKVVQKLQQSDIELFFKFQSNNIYESEKIIVKALPASTTFNFINTPDDLKYFLSINYDSKEVSLTGKVNYVIADQPCMLILENELYQFNDIDSKKILPFIEKQYISIPSSTKNKYFESFIHNSIYKFNVKAEGFSIHDLHDLPVPKLKMENDLRGNPALLLEYQYSKNQKFTGQAPPNLKVIYQKDSNNPEFFKIYRNIKQEKYYHNLLLEWGLNNQIGAYYSLDLADGNYQAQLHNMVTWINRYRSDLTDQGFQLEDKISESKYYLDTFELQVQFTEDNDWFDINAVIIFNEFQITFYSLKNHIKNNIREFELPNGEIFIIPDEWFSRYKDFFVFAESEEKENIKLKKQHFLIFDQTFQGVKKEKYQELLVSELENTLYPVPNTIKAKLRPYQHTGYSWMYKMQELNMGVCLADDMGLGKTLQTLTLLSATIDNCKQKDAPVNNDQSNANMQLSLFDQPKTNKTAKASLIILPTSLVYNWENEIKTFVPNLNVIKYVGSNRENFTNVYNNADLILTSYGIIRNDLNFIKTFEFLYVILDESQIIKNPKSKTYRAVVELKSQYRLVLTGTPIENSLTDLWAQMNFLNEGLLGNYNYFRNEFVIPIENRQDEEQKDKLKQLIRPFILRRNKLEVASDLPDMTEQTIFCEMSDDQQKYYEKEKSMVRNAIIDNISKVGVEKSSMIILQALTKLRQISNHPVLVDDSYLQDSGKVEEIIRNMDNIVQEGHKVLIFSSFVKYLNLIGSILEEKNYSYCKLTGETKDRGKIVNEFQNNESVKFFLISIKAGGVGLNLTAADYVFILDPWWNPAVESQAIARSHRIGQSNNVIVYRYITKNTIEEKIQLLQQKKAKLAESLIHENNPFKAFTKESLLELFD